MLLQPEQPFHFLKPTSRQPGHAVGRPDKQIIRAEDLLIEAVRIDRPGAGPALDPLAVVQRHHFALRAAVEDEDSPVPQPYPHSLLPACGARVFV